MIDDQQDDIFGEVLEHKSPRNGIELSQEFNFDPGGAVDELETERIKNQPSFVMVERSTTFRKENAPSFKRTFTNKEPEPYKKRYNIQSKK